MRREKKRDIFEWHLYSHKWHCSKLHDVSMRRLDRGRSRYKLPGAWLSRTRFCCIVAYIFVFMNSIKCKQIAICSSDVTCGQEPSWIWCPLIFSLALHSQWPGSRWTHAQSLDKLCKVWMITEILTLSVTLVTLYVPPSWTLRDTPLTPHSIHAFCRILAINSDFFLKRCYQIDHCNDCVGGSCYKRNKL